MHQQPGRMSYLVVLDYDHDSWTRRGGVWGVQVGHRSVRGTAVSPHPHLH